MGKKSDNVGIVAFNVRRYIANKAAYEVYIEVQNFGTEPANRQLALYNGDTAVDINKISSRRASGSRRSTPSSRRTPTTGCAPRSGRARAPARPTRCALDDQAFALLPARKKQKVLLVTIDNLFLEGALLVYDNIDERKIPPAEYERNPAIADGFDVVIFDDYTPSMLPPPPASLLFFHPKGPNSPIAVTREIEAPHITEVDEAHPVMRWVSMSDVYMDRTLVFQPDARRASPRWRSRCATRSSRPSATASARSSPSGSRCPRRAATARRTCRCAWRSRCSWSTRSTGSRAIRRTCSRRTRRARASACRWTAWSARPRPT